MRFQLNTCLPFGAPLPGSDGCADCEPASSVALATLGLVGVFWLHAARLTTTGSATAIAFRVSFMGPSNCQDAARPWGWDESSPRVHSISQRERQQDFSWVSARCLRGKVRANGSLAATIRKFAARLLS